MQFFFLANVLTGHSIYTSNPNFSSVELANW